jgi:hypothetical protein
VDKAEKIKRALQETKKHREGRGSPSAPVPEPSSSQVPEDSDPFDNPRFGDLLSPKGEDEAPLAPASEEMLPGGALLLHYTRDRAFGPRKGETMERTELKKALRDFERRLKALAREMGVVLEVWRGERTVVLKPEKKWDSYFFPPFALIEQGDHLLLAAFLPREVRRRGEVKGEALPLVVVDLELGGEVLPAAVVGLREVPKRPLFDEIVSELALASLKLVLEAKDALEMGRLEA